MGLTGPLRIAVACSGLGHVQRGIEAWASDLAKGLNRAGIDAVLFGGAPADGVVDRPCLKRTSGTNHFLQRLCLGGWRYGAGSPYDIEQTSFALTSWSGIHRGFDILHVQDPLIARFFSRAHQLGFCQPRIIYANGTGENDTVMRRFRDVQLLTDQAYDLWHGREPPGQSVFMIPNFVDTGIFAPGDRQRARARFGLPPDAMIVLCCAAIRRFHKRIDHLLAEFATIPRRDVLLVIAGGREADTDELKTLGFALLGERVRFLEDVPRENMPELYRAADIFALASLHEMFGTVLIEAMASGLPIVCHDSPAFRGIAGPAGAWRDLSVPGALANGIAAMLDVEARAALARQARSHAERRFSEAVVIPEMIAMYRSVLHRAP